MIDFSKHRIEYRKAKCLVKAISSKRERLFFRWSIEPCKVIHMDNCQTFQTHLHPDLRERNKKIQDRVRSPRFIAARDSYGKNVPLFPPHQLNINIRLIIRRLINFIHKFSAILKAVNLLSNYSFKIRNRNRRSTSYLYLKKKTKYFCFMKIRHILL